MRTERLFSTASSRALYVAGMSKSRPGIFLRSMFCGIVAMGVTGIAHDAAAYQLYSNDGLVVNLNTTLSYSNDFRVGGVSSTVAYKNQPPGFGFLGYNMNDGDLNFQHGMTANTFQILPILDVKDGTFGMHLSGDAYIDTMYLQSNQNDSSGTTNYFVTNNKNFPSGTVAEDGRYAKLLDAFAYDSYSFGTNDEQTVTLKVGRSALLWGQSLFFTNNGIAAGQAPVDLNTALSLANPQAQQVFLPIGQAVLTYQPNSWLTLQGYYQFQWQPTQFPGAGSFFSPLDFYGPGAERVLVGSTPAGPYYYSRAGDLTPPQENGQFGLSAQFQVGNYDLGLYGLRFDAKTPQFYVHNAAVPSVGASGVALGTYNAAFQRDIQIYGASVSTTVGPVNVAGELSTRVHQDLYSVPIFYVAGMNENSNPGWAVGNTLNAQMSAIYITPGLPLMPGGATILAEIEANRVMSVTANKAEIVPGRTPDAVGMTALVSPTYYDVLPNMDVNVPIGFTWFPAGRSEFDNTMNAGTGEVNVGVTATYQTNWKVGINYQDFLGSTTETFLGISKQSLADRSNVSFYIQRTF